MPSWIADSGLCLLAQETRYVARHIRLRSRALSGSFARLLGAGTARSLIQIDGSLIPKRGIGQHAVDTALALGGDNGFDRSVRRLSMPFLFHCQFIAHCSHLSSNRRDRDLHKIIAQGRFPPSPCYSPRRPDRRSGRPSGCSFWEWKGQRRQFVSYDREFCIIRIIERDFKHLIDEIAILIQFVEGRLEQFNLHIEVHPNRPVEADETGVNHSLSVFPF
jgi:hypothetical protein